MNKVSIDFETRSEVDIMKRGAAVYSEDLSTELLCLGYKINGGTTRLWVPEHMQPIAFTAGVDYVETETPEELFECIEKGYTFHGWNMFFEYTIWKNICNKRMGWPEMPNKLLRCTASKASAHALPRKLGKCGPALGLDVVKSDEGHRVMLKLCKPKPIKYQKPGESIYYESPADYEILYQYCVTDVDAEDAIDDYLRDLSPKELEVWQLDQRINKRGLYVDLEAVDAAILLLNEHTDRENTRLEQMTNGIVPKATSRQKMLDYLNDQYSLEMPNLQAATVLEYLENKEIPEEARDVLEIRKSLGKSSTSKYDAFQRSTCSDGRVRDYIMYHAASTGRFGGKLIQPQNFTRGDINNTEPVIEDIKTRDLDFIKFIYGDPISTLSSCIRGMIIATPGKELYVADYSSIEARVLFWVAAEPRGLKLFRDDKDPYVDMATIIYAIALAEVTGDQRFVGKQAILGLGYQMGWKTFITQCAKYKVTIPEEVAKMVVETYRKTYKRVRKLWYNTEDAAVRAVLTGKPQVCNGITWFLHKGFLYAKLPSGRCLAYRRPKIYTVDTPWGDKKAALFFWGVNSVTKQWERQQTYGGRLVENICQAIARDIMAEAMLRVEEAGYPIILTVHDEVISEVDKGFGSLKEFEEILCELPEWATGLPLDSEAWKGGRYKK